jgi:N-acetylglucosamine-6-phosphate deacetylase
MGVETFIRDRFTAAQEYDRKMSRRSTRPADARRDLELEALAEILRGERLIHCHSYRQDEILMLCRVAGDFGFKIGTFQHVLEGYKVAEAIREHALGGSAFSDWWAYKQEVIDAIPYAGAIMHEVGVTVSFNSDDNELARRMNTEAAKAVKYGGVDRAEALKFVTLNPAIQLGIEDHVGSLEVGKDADFVVWSGDPLSTLSRCERTFIDGREYFSIERDAELRAIAKSERNRLMQKVLTEGDKKKRPPGDKEPDKPGEGEDAPGRPGLDAAFVADMRSGGRMLIIPPDAEGDLAALRADDQAKRLEIYFNWMILNGMDPNISRPGDCGCGIQNLMMGGAQ